MRKVSGRMYFYRRIISDQNQSPSDISPDVLLKIILSPVEVSSLSFMLDKISYNHFLDAMVKTDANREGKLNSFQFWTQSFPKRPRDFIHASHQGLVPISLVSFPRLRLILLPVGSSFLRIYPSKRNHNNVQGPRWERLFFIHRFYFCWVKTV